MTMGKIAISLPVEQIELAKLAVAEGRAASVSAYISSALRSFEADDSLDGFVADLLAEFGEPSDAVRAETEAFVAAVDARNRER